MDGPNYVNSPLCNILRVYFFTTLTYQPINYKKKNNISTDYPILRAGLVCWFRLERNGLAQLSLEKLCFVGGIPDPVDWADPVL